MLYLKLSPGSSQQVLLAGLIGDVTLRYIVIALKSSKDSSAHGDRTFDRDSRLRQLIG